MASLVVSSSVLQVDWTGLRFGMIKEAVQFPPSDSLEIDALTVTFIVVYYIFFTLNLLGAAVLHCSTHEVTLSNVIKRSRARDSTRFMTRDSTRMDMVASVARSVESHEEVIDNDSTSLLLKSTDG